MATWPEANQKRSHARNATLELLSDTNDRNYRSAQSNNKRAEFHNLAVSVEQDGQAMSEVSSFHTDSLCSQHDGLQVSVASLVSAEVSYSYRSRDPCVTIGCVSIIVTFFLLVIGSILVIVYKHKKEQKAIIKIYTACEVLTAAGLFGFIGGVTNWLGIKLIFNRIPGLFFSGAITKHFVTAKKLMANFILEAFFSPSQIQKYVNDKSRTYLTAEQIDNQLERLLNSASVEEIINEQLDILMGTPEGLKLRMLGVTKAKLFPLVKPHLLSMKTSIVPLLLSSVESVELLSADHLREQIVDLILTRTSELSAQQVKQLVKDAIYRHLSWIVFWGSVLGAIVGCAAELASIYMKGT